MRIPPEIRHLSLCRGNPSTPETLVFGFFPGSLRSSENTVLQELPDRNSTLTAESPDTLVPVKSPAVTRLLMTEKFRNLVVVEEMPKDFIGGRCFRDQKAAADLLEPRCKVVQALRDEIPLIIRSLVGSPVFGLADIDSQSAFAVTASARRLRQRLVIVETQVAFQPYQTDSLPCAHDDSRRLRFHAPLQASLQQVIESQTRSHFLRQTNGRPQCGQIFSGRSDLLTAFPLRRMGQ